MTRKNALALIRVAGYHGDDGAFIRLYVENRISLAVARREWRVGSIARESGVPCPCSDCRRRVSP